MKTSLGLTRAIVGTLFAVVCIWVPCASVQAATNADSAAQPASQKQAKKKASIKKASGKKSKDKNAAVTPIGKTDPGWGETQQQRVERLTRECKGRPNGGACEGFGGS